MASFMDYSYSSDSSDSDYTGKPQCLDFSYNMLNEENLSQCLEVLAVNGSENKKNADYYESMLLRHNQLTGLPSSIALFENIKFLDLSANTLTDLPDYILTLKNLTSLIVKNNLITNDGLPKDFGLCKSLKEINFSGNCLSRFPEQFLELDSLKFMYLGGNTIPEIPREIWKLQKLQVLYLGGNCLTEIPAEVGYLKSLQALVLSENCLESLPSSIAQLKKLRSLLLHKNRLTTLPPQIVTLKGLMELSLRDNPLVVRFVRDLTYDPPTLLEMAARTMKTKNIPYNYEEVPRHLVAYLESAHHCVNPKCKGVYFDSRVEHVKFVDFCGKYRIPLLQYLCSPNCGNHSSLSETDSDSDSDYRLKKVLLG